MIALGLDTGSIAIYNVRSSSCDHTISAHRDRVTGLAFCNGGCVLVSACVAGSVFIWGKARACSAAPPSSRGWLAMLA